MKDTMTDSSPSAETIRFVIEILSARVTPLAELPQTIANIAHAVARLGAVPDYRVVKPAAAARPERKLPPPPPRKLTLAETWKPPAATRPAPVEPIFRAAPPAAKPVTITAPLPAITAPLPVITVLPPVRRRGRPRKVVATPIVTETPGPEAPAPQPKLMRRAEALAHETEHHAESPPVFRAPRGTLRGVIKWFDLRTGKGALRLTGISGDIIFDLRVIPDSNVKRLYRDQEVEATVEEADGRPRLLSLMLPTRNDGPTLNMMPGEIMGNLRRQPRSVQVEIKRDGIRKSAARAEAEHVFGGVGRIKINRRLTP
jgi:cold shock CspA family protein